jgi:foldase protein PrsA
MSLYLVPALAALVLAGCGQAAAGAKIVATFNGGTVTEQQMNKYVGLLSLLNPQSNLNTKTAKTQILQQYIVMDRILAPKAAKAGFKADPATVQQDVLQLKNQWVQQLYNNSAQSFNSKMQSLNLTDSDIAKVVADQLAVTEYAGSQIPASVVESYYRQHLANFTVTSQRGILVKTKAQAQMIYGLLQKDHSTANWDKLAKQYSQDPGSKDNGGLYANQPASNWVPQYAQAVTTQPIGLVGKPFDTTYGWFVVEVLNRKTEPLAKVRQQVEGQIMSNTSSQYSTLMTNMENEAQKQANIKVTLPASS